MRLRLALSLALLAAIGTTGLAQVRPNFTGNWTLSEPNAGAPAGIMYLGFAFTADQNDRTLTVTPTKHEVHVGERPEQLRAVFNLDGSESKNPLNMSHAINRISRVTFDGGRLVITTMSSGATNNVLTQTQTWSLDPSGDLIVESVLTNQGSSTTSRATYKKR